MPKTNPSQEIFDEESSDDWDVAAIDYFEAKWAVPKSPPNAGSTTVDYLFNGITNPTNTVIIQPVLEYNYNYNKKWTGAAWWVGPSSQMRGAQVSASVGNYIWGILSWETTQAGYWDIKLYNINTGGASVLNTKMINTDVDLNIFCALEGVRITGSKDVPGDTTFYSMTFKHGGSNVSFNWRAVYWAVPGLTLQVVIYSQYKVKLRTFNP